MEGRRKEAADGLFVCQSSTQRGKVWGGGGVTALISCSGCVIYKAGLALRCAKLDDTGLCVCVCQRHNSEVRVSFYLGGKSAERRAQLESLFRENLKSSVQKKR